MRVVRLPGIHHDASCVIVSGTKESILVDPGTSWYQANVIERVESKLGDHPPINKILLTHRHYDTAGAAKHLAEHWGATVHIHSDAVGALEGGDMFTTWASRFNSDMPAVDVIPFNDCDTFDLGDGVIEVIHTPGHTIDSSSFWIPSEGILIVGDLIPKRSHIARWDFPTGCLPDLLDSIEHLLNLEIEMIVPGHGETIVGAGPVLAQLEQQQEVIAEIISNQGRRPQSWPRPAATCNWLTPEPPLPE